VGQRRIHQTYQKFRWLRNRHQNPWINQDFVGRCTCSDGKSHLLINIYEAMWRFPKMEVPPEIIYVYIIYINVFFHEIHPLLVIPHDLGNLHDSPKYCWNITVF
jgi:hypothetical protein